MQFIRKNIVVVLAFAVPIIFVLIVAGSVYFPGRLLSTKYNFVYATCDQSTYPYKYDNSYDCGTYLSKLYNVEEGKLVMHTPGTTTPYNTRLFLHDIESDEGREIVFDEAKSLNLSPLITSPDGVSLSNSYDRGSDFFIFFDSGSNYGYYLTKGSKQRRLNLVNDGDRYYSNYNFRFIGWVI